MRPPHAAAGSWSTWGLAALLMLAVDAVVLHTPLIWGKQTLWVHDPAQRLERLALWQVYDVARTLYRPRRPADQRVAVLGNSLVWFPGQAAYIERALRRAEPGVDVRVDNVSFFGAKIGDIEIVSRQIHRLDPSVVVVALGGTGAAAERAAVGEPHRPPPRRRVGRRAGAAGGPIRARRALAAHRVAALPLSDFRP